MFSVAVFPSLSWLTVFGCPSGLAPSLSLVPFSVFVYARANIIMCLSFSSRVLRYKNLLCNTSVIQRITKKFQGIRIICLVKVCLLALKGLLLHPQSREMRHFRQCYWLGETNVGDFLDSDLHLVSYLSGAKGARTDKTSGGWMVRLLWKFRKKTFSKKLSKTFGGYDKISYLCIRFRKRWQDINESSLKDLR